MTGDAHVRIGHADDLEAVLAIQRESPGAPQWSEATWRGVLQVSANAEPLRRLFVALDEARVAGFVVVMLAGGLAEIESAAVSVASRRKGLGMMLCGYALLWSTERGASQVELEVRAQNATARAMYGRLGFREQGIRRGYYCEPIDDAVLLSVAL